MPRNVSGTYSLYTPGNPVVPSTVITTTWANNTLSDLATAMTDSLSRSGQGGMSAPLQLAAGAIGAPGMTWTAETTSGWYRAGAGDFRYSVSGVDKLTITAALISTAGNFTVGGGALIGAATGGNQGTGTINATALYDDGVQITNQASANPTGTIGLTAVNGAAATFLRSDGAPALSQSIVPTWSGVHTFAAAPVITADHLTISNTDNYIQSTVTSGAVDAKIWWTRWNGGNYTFQTRTDALGTGTDALVFQRSGVNVTNLIFGNSTSNPTYTFSGSGLTTHGGDLTFTVGGTSFSAGYRNVPRSTTTTTFAAADNGRCVAVSAAINIPISVFSAGDTISVYNDSAGAVNITISAGTLRLSGTTTTGTRSLAARGIATLWFNVGGATPEVIASGNIT